MADGGRQFSAADVLMATSLKYGMHIMKVVPAHPAFVGRTSSAQAARPAFQRANAIDSGDRLASLQRTQKYRPLAFTA